MTSLYELATKLTDKRIPVIPVKNKKAIIPWTERRHRLATDEELKEWFANGKGCCAGIPINNSEFAIDTDGNGETVFRNRLLPRFSDILRKKMQDTTQSKTPHGYHRIFNINEQEIPDGIKTKSVVTYGNDHNGIEIIGKGHLLVIYGSGYETVIDIDAIETLSKLEVGELLDKLNVFRAETSGIKTIVGILKSHYTQPNRNNIVFTLSGYLHKNRVPERLAHDTIEQLAIETNDDEIASRLRVVADTYSKDADSEQVSGLQALLVALDNDNKAINEIKQVFAQLCPNSKFNSSSFNNGNYENDDGDEDDDNDDDLAGINSSILEKLTPHIFGVISSDPLIAYVAHKGKRNIIKVVIQLTSQTTSVDVGQGRKQESKTPIQLLRWKYRLVKAIPIRVEINQSPIEESKTYKVTFIDKSNKSFTIGPCSISSIIEDLNSRGKIIKKSEAIDALTTILDKYEELGIAEINESVTTSGYYYFNGKFEYHDITQVLDKEPSLEDAIKCTEFLDELSTKWVNKAILPTVVKWSTIAPFNYIIKTIGSKWQQGLHGYGISSSGKTSLGKIALAVWRLHTNELRIHYQLGFSNIDTAARFGNVVSKTTYPKVVNEVSALQEKNNSELVEDIKKAIESPYARGRFNDGKYQYIPSLSNLFLTGNQLPPIDSGYRSRSLLAHFSKEDVHERGSDDAVEFEKWLDSKLHLLGVLGDFITSYVIIKPVKPQDSILFSEKSIDDMSKEIIAEFYKFAGKDKPEWLDRNLEQRSIVEENTENAYFEIRGFLMTCIANAFSRHYRRIGEEETVPNNDGLLIRLNFCLNNSLIPFLHRHRRQDSLGRDYHNS